MPDARDYPEARRLQPRDLPQIRGHLSVPVVLSNGELYGTCCAFGLLDDPPISVRDLVLMEVFAEAAAMVIEPQVRLEQRQDEIRNRLQPRHPASLTDRRPGDDRAAVASRPRVMPALKTAWVQLAETTIAVLGPTSPGQLRDALADLARRLRRTEEPAITDRTHEP